MRPNASLLRDSSWYSSCSQGIWAIQGGGLLLLTVMSFFPALFHIQEFLFFTLLGLAILTGWFEGKKLWVRTPIDIPLVLLISWILLTIPFSLNPEYSFEEWRKLIAQCLVFYWAVYVIGEISQQEPIKSFHQPRKFLKEVLEKSHFHGVFFGVLIGIGLLSAFAFVDFIGRGGNWQDRTVRAVVPGSDYNWLSTYLVLAMPIVVYCGVTANFVWQKVLSAVIFTVALLAYAASYTRAGWLAALAQVCTWGFVTRRRILLMSFMLGIIFVGLVFFGMGQLGYQSDTLHPWTLEARMQVWKLGVTQLINSPLVGIGYGNNTFQPVLIDSPMGKNPMHLHNTPLMIGVGSGIPALIFFLWVFLRLGEIFFAREDSDNSSNLASLKLCLGIVLVGFFCRNLFDYMFAGSLAYLFWILMACGIASCRVGGFLLPTATSISLSQSR